MPLLTLAWQELCPFFVGGLNRGATEEMASRLELGAFSRARQIWEH
jgi:hypothetical protein